jgi:histidine decarboxylase
MMFKLLRPTLNGIRQRSFQRVGTSASKFRPFATKKEDPEFDFSLKEDTTPLFSTVADSEKSGKIGSSSPWAVFDAWGADGLPDASYMESRPADLAMLSRDELAVGTNPDEDPNDENVTKCLEAYDRVLATRATAHLGYPYNLRYNHEELYPFMKYSINNLGDPFVTSNYGVHSRHFEQAVLDFFADLWKLPSRDDYWGYVTTCGTEGNLHGILLAREVLPDGVLYSSTESHYSIFKAARYYRMEAEAISTLATGEIDYAELQKAIEKNIDKPVIINCNVGTTVKGAVDNLDRILRILDSLNIPRERFYIHCDGALFALMLPFVQYAPQINFEKPIDSIAVSGHKMLGCPMPSGVQITRRKHIEKVEQRIEYLNSVDTTIMGSRNGQAALYMWYSLKRKGMKGIRQDVEHCISVAQYLRDELKKVNISAQLNDLSSTVVMEKPVEENLIQRWQLACEEDIAHVVVMPNVTKEKVDVFVKDFSESRDKHGAMKETRDDSPLTKVKKYVW